MYCKTVIDLNIQNMAKWHYLNKHYADFPHELYIRVMDFIVSKENKCTFSSDKYGKCTECDISICKTHIDVWNCLPCNLILCKGCFYKNGHASHTSWKYMDYDI